MKICQERKRRAEFWVSVFLFLLFCFFGGVFWFLIKEMTERGSDRKCEARRGEEGGKHFPAHARHWVHKKDEKEGKKSWLMGASHLFLSVSK